MTSVTVAASTTTTTTTNSSVMKCQDCNAPFTRCDEFESYAGGDRSVTQGVSSENNGDVKRKNCWWWCRDCMATLCR
uniref:Uncharacterized protein n=1 Tax=Setaria digitata TaxID=48799 RepID=A0A915PTX8_9BILA